MSPSLEHAAVGGLESIDSHRRHAKLDEHLARDPVVLAPRVDHDIEQLPPAFGRGERRDAERRPKDSHVVDHTLSRVMTPHRGAPAMYNHGDSPGGEELDGQPRGTSFLAAKGTLPR